MKYNISRFLFLLLFIVLGCSGSEEAFRKAKVSDSIYAFEKYLEEYPNSEYSEEAKKILSLLYWKKAKSKDDISSYEEFLLLFPESELKETAKLRINEIKLEKAWEQSKYFNTIESYKNFLNVYPNSKYSASAKNNIDLIEEKNLWTLTLNHNSIEYYESFLQKYPNSKYLSVAEERIKELKIIRPIWEKLLLNGKLDDFRQFISQYPNSSFSILAKQKINEIEEKEWEKALEKNSIKSYKNFLDRFPNSSYRSSAEAIIVDIEVDNIFKNNHGYLPPATKIASYVDRNYSIVNIFNNTEFNLTIRYSGKDSFKMILKPYEKSAAEILNGNFKVAASVDSRTVMDYAGEEIIDGSDYSVIYYIVTGLPNEEEYQSKYLDDNEYYPVKRKVDSKYK